jgi:hypothetical protein
MASFFPNVHTSPARTRARPVGVGESSQRTAYQIKKDGSKDGTQVVFSKFSIFFNADWWRGLDSNQRRLSQRIYSPSPLATRAPLQTRKRGKSRVGYVTANGCRVTLKSAARHTYQETAHVAIGRPLAKASSRSTLAAQLPRLRSQASAAAQTSYGPRAKLTSVPGPVAASSLSSLSACFLAAPNWGRAARIGATKKGPLSRPFRELTPAPRRDRDHAEGSTMMAVMTPVMPMAMMLMADKCNRAAGSGGRGLRNCRGRCGKSEPHGRNCCNNDMPDGHCVLPFKVGKA